MNDVWARALYYAREEECGSARVDTEAAATPPDVERQPEHFTPAPALADVQEGRAVLQFGQEGDTVRHVQQLLDIHRDGDFGVNTRKAVLAFQRVNQVAVSAGNEGNVDRVTLEALERAEKTDWALALDKIDPREKTPRAHPELRRCLGFMAQALARQGMQVMITDGLRTFAEQDTLFSIGRRGRQGERVVTNARGGLSNHNYGMAVDLYPVIDGKVRTSIPEHASSDFRNRFRAIQQAIGVEAERVGLTWGGRWAAPVDMPHVQLLAQDDLSPRAALEIYRAHDNSLQAVWDEATRRFHRSES
jgi:peptidoglycan hydrolase-like protein with peptidoglycan-binding domain